MSVPLSHRTPPQQPCLRQKIDTHSHQLRQPTNTLMRHKLILHKRERRSHSTSRKIRRQSVKAHCEEDRIATAAGPVQRICGTRRGGGDKADVVVVVDCCAGCCAVEFVVCWFFVSGFLFANFVGGKCRCVPTSRTVPGGSLSRSSSFESEKA